MARILPVVQSELHPTSFSRRRLLNLATALLLAGLLLVPLAILAVPARPTAPGPVRAAQIKRETHPAAGQSPDAPAGMKDVIIYLVESANLNVQSFPEDKLARRSLVIQRLKQVAERSQIGLRQRLDELSATGQVDGYEPLWIVNAVKARAKADVLEELAARPDVERIILDAELTFLPPQEVTSGQSPAGITGGLAMIGAEHVWEGIGIDGQGVTVAIVDTGVDWRHPDLLDNYRGNRGGGNANHALNWFDAVQGSAAPFDPNGHGTHVAGTAVGHGGIGVAPGARWIGVRALDANGNGVLSDIHTAFQWLLAPGGRPEMAPDIVNNSWGGATTFVEFMPDVSALHAAGIVPIFAAGNTGPEAGTINAPASYPDTIAAGASDESGELTWFSSRGPSPLSSEPKPTLLAPGTAVLSALPGGAYGYKNGTSMATPHLAGAYALLLSAGPSLTRPELTHILTSTARSVDQIHPNQSSGWGLVDVYGAVASFMQTQNSVGTIQGAVSDNGQPLPGIPVSITTPSGVDLVFRTDASGRYRAVLLPGLYNLTVRLFGYQEFQSPNIAVLIDRSTGINASLLTLPSGTVAGHLFDADSQLPISGTVSVKGTPVVARVGANGSFSLQLPVGTYELVASRTGYRLERAVVTLQAGQTWQQDLFLSPGPAALLVDSGRWYFAGQLDFFRSALEDTNYAYDVWTVATPFGDRPTLDVLDDYDAVIWSDPLNSPGAIGAGKVISDYLGLGGNLLITGQDIGRRNVPPFDPEEWWLYQLRAGYLGKSAPPLPVSGDANSTFAGLNLTFNGSDSAGNQVATDQVAPLSGSLSEVVFRYSDGQPAALEAGRCGPYRLVYLGFGLEGISGRQSRADVVSRSFDFFDEPEPPADVDFIPPSANDLAPPGGRLTYTLDLRNLSEILTDTFQLRVGGNDWPASLLTTTLTIGPCQSGRTEVTVDVPSGLPHNITSTVWVEAVSTNVPEFSERWYLSLKTADHVLLVDDDRWFDQEQVFRTALDEAGFRYDFWATDETTGGRGSPSRSLLNAYDIVIWYTGYDWLTPLTTYESQALHGYLAGGGRLFLTSQDYLRRHMDDPLTQDFLGVQQYREPITPTKAYGGDNLALLGNLPGPLFLDYGPYQNFSDGLIRRPNSQVSVWSNQGYAGGLATAGSNWRSVFWAFPFESLPSAVHATAMNRIMGWLSDLGESTFEVDRRVSSPNEPDPMRSYTLTLRQQAGSSGGLVAITNTVPVQLTIDPASVTGGAVFDPQTMLLTWNGLLEDGDTHEIAYSATLTGNLPAGAQIDNAVSIFVENHGFGFERIVPTWIGAPDLTRAALSVLPDVVRPSGAITYQLHLPNIGADAGIVSATIRLPDLLHPLTETLNSTLGQATLSDRRLQWQGQIQPGQALTLTIAMTVPLKFDAVWLPATAIISDTISDPVVRDATLWVEPYKAYFPAIAKS